MKRASQMTKRIAVACTAFCVCSSIAWDSPTSHKENSVTSLNYSQENARTLVEIGVLDDPTFSVYALKNPERVVVEILDCDSSQRISPIQVRNGVVDSAAVSFAKSTDSSACRIILGLDKETTYAVDSTSDKITIAVDGKPNLTNDEMANAYAELKKSRDEALENARAIVKREQDEASAARLEAQIAKSDAQSALDRELATHRQLEAQEAQNEELKKQLAQQNEKIEALNQEVLAGSAARKKLKKLEAQNDSQTEIEAQNDSQIAELKAQARQGRHAREELLKLKAEHAKLQEQLNALSASQPTYAQSAPTTAPIDTSISVASSEITKNTADNLKSAPIDAQAAAQASIRDIQFTENGDAMQVVLTLSSPVSKVQSIDGGLQKSILKIDGAVLPDNFNKKYDTSAFNKGIKFIDSTQTDSGIELIAQASSQTTDAFEQNGNTITWNLKPLRSDISYKASIDRRTQAMVSAAEPNSYELSSTYGAQKSLKDSPLAKRKITLDIHDADINDLLRLLSDEINTSIVVNPDVKGNVTLSLKSVPLDQALDIILRMHNLGMRYEGNVIWIAKAETFRAEEERLIKAAEVRERLEPLEVRLIPVNYATASDLQANVSSLLSSRGSVNIDTRTNTLILKDVAANLDAAEILVNNLDTQTPQILIEARIVETQANFTKEMGIQWGGDGIASAQTGNATGIVFPSTVGIAGGSTSDNNSGTSASPNFAVNLPASVGTGAGGALGIVLGSVGGAVNLNIRLSSLENKGFLKIVSAPRIMTLDNIQASIEQGTSIPISVVSAAGAQTVFYDAKLNLQVTPHVTRDGNVYLKIDITKNEPDFGNTGASGDPSIIQKEAHTELLIPDGETTVIGGIYTRNTSQSMASVPFFGSIPILGYLFKSTSETDNRTELLIFITPRIINRDASIAASGHGSFIPPVEREDSSKK